MSEYKWPLMKNTLSFLDRVKLAKFVLTSDKFTQGEKVKQFEDEWSKWLGCKHSLFVTSGSTANFLLVAAIIEKYNLKKGDKVLLPACTWVTNINPIFQLGLTPIFCDVNLENYSFNLDNFKKISENHTDIKVVFVTHLLGIPADVDSYKKYFPNAIFIDDVCESHGCLNSDGSKVGSNSIGSTFSFYFGHHMSTVEGGMISTNDTELYDLMKLKRSHGLARVSDKFNYYIKQNPEIEKSFLFVTDGYNFRNTELGAVLGLSQLKRLDKFIQIRRNNYKQFVNIVNKHKDKFYPVVYNWGNSCFCFPFICKTKEIKNKLISDFQKNKIEYRPIVGGNLLRQPYLNYNLEKNNKEIYVDIIHENGIYIGNSQFVTEKDLNDLNNILMDF